MSQNIGKVGMCPQGMYERTRAYERLDVVTYQGSSWVAIVDVPAQISPALGSDYWQLVARIGETGPQGPVGPQGNSAFMNDGTVNKYELVNNLTQGGENAVLSAEQGKILKQELTELESNTDSKFAKLESENTQLAKEIANAEGRVNAEIEDFKEAVTEQVENYKPIVINGNVANAADEEDITSENNLLKLKDRSALNGMGHVILRKNKAFAEQVKNSNTIYEIRYDFDLGGAEVDILDGCVLDFQGGSLTNGVIVGNKTRINSSISHIFKEGISIKGTWVLDSAFPEWFGAKADGSDDWDGIQSVINQFGNKNIPIVFPQKKYRVTKSLTFSGIQQDIYEQHADGYGIIIRGNGNQNTTIVLDSNAGIPLFDFRGLEFDETIPAYMNVKFLIQDLVLFSSKNKTNVGIALNNSFGSTLQNVKITFFEYGVFLNTHIWGLLIDRCYIGFNRWGIYQYEAGSSFTTEVHINESRIRQNGITGDANSGAIQMKDWQDCYFTNTSFEATEGGCVFKQFGWVSNLRVSNCRFEETAHYSDNTLFYFSKNENVVFEKCGISLPSSINGNSQRVVKCADNSLNSPVVFNYCNFIDIASDKSELFLPSDAVVVISPTYGFRGDLIPLPIPQELTLQKDENGALQVPDKNTEKIVSYFNLRDSIPNRMVGTRFFANPADAKRRRKPYFYNGEQWVDSFGNPATMEYCGAGFPSAPQHGTIAQNTSILCVGIYNEDQGQWYDVFGYPTYYHRGMSAGRPVFQEHTQHGAPFFDVEIMQQIYWDGLRWIDGLGIPVDAAKRGGSVARPSNVPIGFMFFDMEIGRPIWYTGSGWINAVGESV